MTTTPVRQEYEVQLEPLLSVPVERNRACGSTVGCARRSSCW